MEHFTKLMLQQSLIVLGHVTANMCIYCFMFKDNLKIWEKLWVYLKFLLNSNWAVKTFILGSENIYFLVVENPYTEPSSRVPMGNDFTVLAIYQAAFI